MTALAIILSIIVFFMLLRFGVAVEYGDEGFIVSARVGPFRLRIFPKKEKPGAAGRKARRKARKQGKSKKKKKKEEPKKQMPGSLREYLDMLPPVKNMLSRIRRRLLIKRLAIYYTAAGTDAATTALTFGAANAVMGAMAPILENSFRIKRRDFRTNADFTSAEQKIYVHATISMAVWESIYIVFALLPILTGLLKSGPGTKDRGKDRGKNRNKDRGKNRDKDRGKDRVIENDKDKGIDRDRKEETENGKAPDKRTDGNDDAEDKGDD